MAEPCSETETSLETGESSSDMLFVVMLAGEERFRRVGERKRRRVTVIGYVFIFCGWSRITLTVSVGWVCSRAKKIKFASSARGISQGSRARGPLESLSENGAVGSGTAGGTHHMKWGKYEKT